MTVRYPLTLRIGKSLTINPVATKQYLLLYLLVICHDATIYRENTLIWRGFIIAACLILGSLSKKQIHISASIVIFAILILSYVMLRGGVQLTLSYIEHILIFYTAYECDKKNFCLRFVNVVMFFAAISLPFYLIGLINPEMLLKLIPFETNVTWANYGYQYFMRGRLLYTVRCLELERNNSIFTEPGVYQILLNSALFIVLFMREKLYSYSAKKIRGCMLILAVCIITTASTTAYIGLALNVSFYLLSIRQIKRLSTDKKDINRVVKSAIILILIVSICILVNYFYAKEDSILSRFALKKIAEMFRGGTSGHARTSMISICMKAAIGNPFGLGEEATSLLLKRLDDGANGAILVHSFASIGIFPTLLIVGSFYKNLLSKKIPLSGSIAIIMLYLNTALAQSRLLYPALIMLPVIYKDYIKEFQYCKQ